MPLKNCCDRLCHFKNGLIEYATKYWYVQVCHYKLVTDFATKNMLWQSMLLNFLSECATKSGVA